MYFFYFATTYESTAVGRRIVGIQCDKCRHEYCFELSRIGDGGARAHYGIGAEFAKNRAAVMAENDLKAKLENESDLVPCPNCNWINEEQIAIYRKSRYQGLAGCFGVFALFGACLATIICFLIVGRPNNNGDVGDQGIMPYFVFAIPAFMVVSAVLMFQLQSWLRNRINPNENFPDAPVVPPGSPTAKYYDEATDTLTPAKTKGS